MRRFSSEPRPALYAATALLIAGAFTLDLTTSMGMALWVVYFIPLILCLFTSQPLAPVVVGIVSGALIGGAYLLLPRPAEELLAASQLNRSLASGALVGFGFVGRRFVAQNTHLRLQDWLKAGQAQLSLRMQGEQDTAQLARKILSFLAEYTGAVAGSVYTADEAGGFARKGVYGLKAPLESGHELVEPGETLVGRAASDQRVLVVHDVPEGYSEVGSGIGSAVPRALVLAPAQADQRVIGVIELGFFTPPPPAVTHLLDNLLEPVGFALRSAQYRQRQAELLEETQRQAEELQAQHEELNAANEELEDQKRTLQESQAQLEEFNAQLEEQTRTLESQKEQLSAAQDVLRRKATDLERATQYKSEFLANMSHELRTPLNSSLILAKLLADNEQGNLSPEQVRYAGNIYSAGMDLLALINDILDLSKIEAGKLGINLEDTAIATLFDELKQRFEPLAAEKDLHVSFTIDPACPAEIETDKLRLLQVLSNLLSNAVKFTERGDIGLRAELDQQWVLFSVEDTGAGIPPEQHDIIFEAFRQADGTTNRRHGGTGLGLSISRELVDLLGGAIHLHSVPGQGSVFTISLPLRAGAKRAEPRSAAPVPSISDKVAASGAGGDLPAAAEDDREQLHPEARVVLIVEDDAVFAQIIRDLAHELQFQCLIGRNAEEGMQLAREYDPVAIILDIGLPDYSGLTVLDLLKRDASARHIPIHVVSVHDYQRVAREMGAVGYALKPVKRDELVATFRHLEARLDRRARSVLVVEDDPVQRDAIIQLLEGPGVSIDAAETAGEAHAKLNAATYDCLVLDLMLKGPSGFDLLERMAKGSLSAHPPVIVYTARELTMEEEQHLRRHARSIIIKGARSPERLLEEVTLFLHQVEADLPQKARELLRAALSRESLFSSRRILVVEDDVRNVFALTSALEPKGAAIDVVRNGLDALRRLEEEPPIDLVLMDIMMPEMDGLTAIREIRKAPRWADLPILALTAKAMPDDRLACINAGANDYIAKPIDIDKLLSLIRVWMPR